MAIGETTIYDGAAVDNDIAAIEIRRTVDVGGGSTYTCNAEVRIGNIVKRVPIELQQNMVAVIKTWLSEFREQIDDELEI